MRFLDLRVTVCSYPVALQSPIEYQRKERNTAVMRSQPSRVPQASPRPYSSVPGGSDKPPKGSSYNPPLPPLKISTSNGSPGFDYHQPGDKFEATKVSDSLLLQPHHSEGTASVLTLEKRSSFFLCCSFTRTTH